jgi:L-fucose isomerase-like protein
MRDFRKITLGIAPTRRDTFPPFQYAVEAYKGIRKRLYEIFGGIDNLEVVDIDGIVPDGLLVENSDIPGVVKLFRDRNVDAIFTPHANFGQEEVIAKLCKTMGLPVLLWGPRDPEPDPDAPVRPFDVQCGLFATSRALKRYGVPFTYIENCWLDSPVLEKGIKDFLSVAAAVKAFKDLRVLQISTRPRQFLSVKVNENDLLEKFGIEVTPVESTEITGIMDDYLANRKGDLKDLIADWGGYVDLGNMDAGQLEKMAALELSIMDLSNLYDCPVAATECWALFKERYGIRTCFVFGDLTNRGLPVACETDIHGAVTSALALGAARGESATFLADVTIRHPHNDNAELFWHCGPFPASLARPDRPRLVMPDGLGFWELKKGDITITRFDADGGAYKLFADEGRAVDGPGTDGNYVWIETNDWPAWERKLIYGPYIHHVVGVYGNYREILHEACRHIGVAPDRV